MTVQELQRENQQLRQSNEAFKEKISTLELQLGQLYKLIQGFKSERFIPEIIQEQLSLFSENIDKTQQLPAPKETITYTREKQKHPGRGALPEHLPVREVILEPEEDVSNLKKIGEEVSETLEYTPASLVKRRTIRPKYARENQQGVVIAPLPTRPIEKSIAEACLLSYILVSKYVDHMPFYRQIQRFKREFGWEPASSTLSDWMSSCCQLLEPLYNTLKQKILEAGTYRRMRVRSRYWTVIKRAVHIKDTNGSITIPCKNWCSLIIEKDVDNKVPRNSFWDIKATFNVMGTRYMIKLEKIQISLWPAVLCMLEENLLMPRIMIK